MSAATLATAAIELVDAIEREFLARGNVDTEAAWFDVPLDTVDAIAERLANVASLAHSMLEGGA